MSGGRRAQKWRADADGVPRRADWRAACAPSTARRTSSSPTTSTRTSRIFVGFTRSLRGLLADDGWVSIEVHHAAEPRQPRPVRHDLPRAFPVLHGALGACARSRPPAWRSSTSSCSPRTAARSGCGRAPSEVAGPADADASRDVLRRRGGGRAAHGRRPRQLRRGPSAVRHDLLRSCSTAARRASASSATARRARATRCSTTAVSAATCSSTPSTATPTSTAGSPRAPASRSHDPAQIAKDRPDVVLALPVEPRDRADRAAATSGSGAVASSSRSARPSKSKVQEEHMKVVLFCGGYGMRMRDGASDGCPSRCTWSGRAR